MDTQEIPISLSPTPRTSAFCYTELQNGAVLLECWSAGRGRFHEGSPDPSVFESIFDVRKNLDQASLEVTVRRHDLVVWLSDIFHVEPQNCHGTQQTLLLNLYQVLPKYAELKWQLMQREAKHFYSYSSDLLYDILMTDNIRLFVEGFLLESAIFETFGFESLHESGHFTVAHFQDMRFRSVHSELDELDDFVELAASTLIDDEAGSEDNLSTLFDFQCAPSNANSKRSMAKKRKRLLKAIGRRDFEAMDSILAQVGDKVSINHVIAAMCNYVPVIFSRLIHHCVSVDFNLESSVYIAAEKGLLDPLKMLVDAGAPIDKRDSRSGLTPLTAAASNGHLPIVDFILKDDIDMNKTPFNRRFLAAPLVEAARSGHLTIVDYLVTYGAQINNMGRKDSPLIAAANAGHLPIVEYLVAHGANVNLTDGLRSSPLSFAASSGHLPVVEYLVAHRADVNLTRYDDSSALSFAASSGHLPVVEYLVAHGADVNLTSYDGLSALSLAASSGHLPVVEYLVAHGANVNLTDYQGFSPLSLAASSGHLPVVKYLERIRRVDLSRRYYNLENQVRKRWLCIADYSLQEINDLPGKRLLKKLSASQRRLLSLVDGPNATRLSLFQAERSRDIVSIWKGGTSVMRELLNGRLPTEFHRVISFLQVADAIRLTTPDRASVCSEKPFIRSVSKWGELLHPDDRSLFTVMVECLWGRFEELVDPTQPALEVVSLLQDLVVNLVSQTRRCEARAADHLSGGHSLRYFQHRATSTMKIETENSTSQSTRNDPPDKPGLHTGLNESPDGAPEVGIPPVPSDPDWLKIAELMASAVFGVVLLWLFYIRYQYDGMQLLSNVDWGEQYTDETAAVARNCFLLALYLGIATVIPTHTTKIHLSHPYANTDPEKNESDHSKTHRVPPSTFTDSGRPLPAETAKMQKSALLSPTQSITCHNCGKVIHGRCAKNNMDRHIRLHCKKNPNRHKGHSCEKCGRRYVREDYVRDHRCKRKMGGSRFVSVKTQEL
ncbi:hypothetical protein F5Y19DRAFT_439151 [Xylariaceae sp. FL1651]|nr:hypothetical protein F5Y19DRAFT_439151 [Xylariaceae sp. FL1651]